MKTTRELPRLPVLPVRRTTIGLLAALAIALGAVATPLAGTADAGGLRGGVVLRSGAGTADFEPAGSTLGSGTDRAPAAGDPDADTFQTTGSKAGVGVGSGDITK